MASAEKKRKVDFSLPDCVVKSLECPVCLETIKDPPIYLCEKGHGLCQTCRTPLKAQKKPCPVCRGKLTDARNLGLENILDQLPKIKCKNEGCTFERSDGQLVRRHEDEECRERPVRCELCLESIALSKLFGHLGTNHLRRPLPCRNLGEEWSFSSVQTFLYARIMQPIGKGNNDYGFIFNWKSYDANSIMFWLSLCGSPKEAKQYEYTIKIKSSADLKAGRTNPDLLTGKGDCLSCDLSQEDVKKKKTMSAAPEVMLFPMDILQKAAEGHDQKRLEWSLMVQKK